MRTNYKHEEIFLDNWNIKCIQNNRNNKLWLNLGLASDNFLR